VIRRAALAIAAAMLCGCATARPRPSAGNGIADCPAGASNTLLSVEALQCWLMGPHGRWRTLSHESHFDVLVVQAEALDLRNAKAIARAFAANEHTTFSEILVYVHQPRRSGHARIRRVRWNGPGPLETFDFTAPAGQ
jgi:hypothetical protein